MAIIPRSANKAFTIPRIPPLTGQISPAAHADDLASAYRCRWFVRGIGGRLGRPLGGQHLQQPLLGLLAGCNGFIVLLLGLLPAGPLHGQFVLHTLESLLDNLLSPSARWIASSLASRSWASLVWRFVHRRLGRFEQMLGMLSGRDLLPQSQPSRFKRIGAGCVTLIPMDDRDRNLAIPDETPMFSRAIKITLLLGPTTGNERLYIIRKT